MTMAGYKFNAAAKNAAGYAQRYGQVVTASEFGGHNDPSAFGHSTASGKIANDSLIGFAELSRNPSARDFSALGKLPMGTLIRVTYKGRSIVIPKVDVGAGGPGVGGRHRSIDLTYGAARKLGFNGLGNVTYSVVGHGQNQSAPPGSQRAPKPSAQAPPQAAQSPDQAAQRASLISQYLSTEHQPGALTGLASGLLGLQQEANTAGTPSAPSVPATANKMPQRQQGGGAAGYTNPFGSSLKGPGRVDEGVDPNIQGPIRAIGNAKVVNISHNFYKGEPYIVYQLQDGPHAGKYIYVSELVTPHVRVGQRVRAGDVIATGHGPIETGWAGGPRGGFMPLANRAQGGNYTEGAVTGPGRSFAQFLRALGARAS